MPNRRIILSESWANLCFYSQTNTKSLKKYLFIFGFIDFNRELDFKYQLQAFNN